MFVDYIVERGYDHEDFKNILNLKKSVALIYNFALANPSLKN